MEFFDIFKQVVVLVLVLLPLLMIIDALSSLEH